MKSIIITISLLTLCFAALGQQKNPDVRKDTVQTVIKLTDWQFEQLKNIEESQKALEERKQFLLITILDANKVDPKKVTSYEIQEKDLVVVKKE